MKRDRSIRKTILKRLDESEYRLVFRKYKTHELGGFEVYDHPEWTDEEAYNIDLMIEEGLVVQDFTKGDEPWLDSYEGGVYKESYVRLSSLGHDARDRINWIYAFYINVRENIPVVITSVVSGLALAYFSQFIELPKEREYSSEKSEAQNTLPNFTIQGTQP